MKFAPLCLLAGLFLIATTTFGQDTEVLTNEDVVRLTQSGLPGSVIVAKIGTSSTDFDTSVDALVALSEAGVDPEVLEAMAKAGASPAPAADLPSTDTLQVVTGTRASQVANVASSFEGTPCERPGIFLSDEGSMVDLELTQPTSTKTGSGVLSSLTYGIKSTKAKAMIRGARSQVRTNQRRPVFYFCFEEAQAGLSYQTTGAVNPAEFLLVAFDVLRKKNQRSFVTAKLNIWTGGQGGSPPKQLREVEYKQLAPGVYEVTAQSLDPGEYAFYYGGGQTTLVSFFGSAFGASLQPVPQATGSGRVFAFGVD